MQVRSPRCSSSFMFFEGEKMKQEIVRAGFVGLAALGAAAIPANAQLASLSKGQQLLANWGMQFNGAIALTSDHFNETTLKNTNFNSPIWAWTSDTSNGIQKLGPSDPWG